MANTSENFEFSIAGVPIETPIVNAAGSINGTNSDIILHEVEKLANTAIGAITVGSITVPYQAGNEAVYGSPVYHHNPETGMTLNALGMPNIGLRNAIDLMPDIVAIARAKNKPVIASVAATVETEDSGDTFKQLSKLTYFLGLKGADLIEVNPGSPNTLLPDGTRKPMLAYDLPTMERLVSEIAPWSGTLDSKVGIKLPPYISYGQRAMIPKLANLFNESEVFGFITVSNSIPFDACGDFPQQQVLSVPDRMGSISGPAAKHHGRAQLLHWKEALGEDSKIDIISALGVDSGKELALRRQLGAAAAGGVTFLWESDNWGNAITNMISEWANAEMHTI